jgi:hypothetical protein
MLLALCAFALCAKPEILTTNPADGGTKHHKKSNIE